MTDLEALVLSFPDRHSWEVHRIVVDLLMMAHCPFHPLIVQRIAELATAPGSTLEFVLEGLFRLCAQPESPVWRDSLHLRRTIYENSESHN